MVDKKIDLTGVNCPDTFVKSKLAIEPMKKGDLLEITLDNKEAVENIPRSMKNHGHQINSVNKIEEDKWKIRVKKN